MALAERKLEAVTWEAKEKGVEYIGRLLNIEKVKFKNGDTGLSYRLRREDGVMVVFPGVTDINRKLQLSDIGCVVAITYKGEDESREMTGDKNRPKLFIVAVDEDSKPKPAEAPFKATDDDIPF